MKTPNSSLGSELIPSAVVPIKLPSIVLSVADAFWNDDSALVVSGD